MEINPCKDCLYYEDCIKGSCSYDFPDKLTERIYYMFTEGYDCFIRITRDEE